MSSLTLFSGDFMTRAGRALPESGLLCGSDGDFEFVVLDGSRYDLGVLDCRDEGLVDGLAALARPPAVVMNAQFIDSPRRRRPEGQVARAGRLIIDNPKPQAWYVAQVEGEQGMARFRVGRGDPWWRERRVRDALGGLGPVLAHGRAIEPLPHWAETIYDKDAGVGRGVIAFDRPRGLILLLVQRDRRQAPGPPQNARSLNEIRSWLVTQQVTDAVFNDGSDSEGIAVEGTWRCEPATLKQLSTGFALAFSDTRVERRATFVAIDGTPTADASTFARAMAATPRLLYGPQNVAPLLKTRQSPLGATVAYGVMQTWQFPSENGARLFQRVIRESRLETTDLDLLYVSGHATRHGKLIYHRYGASGGREFVAASVWDPSFKTDWAQRPRWIILAGCAVLALRYSRLVALNDGELQGLIGRHRDMHGERATVTGLRDKTAAWQVYHPGWAWYTRALKDSGIRGILGYWYRSPGPKGGDVEIVESFSKAIAAGRPFLDAWRDANQRGFFSSAAAWAAMVRDGAEGDTLETLCDASITAGKGNLLYHDAFQQGHTVPAAYQRANDEDVYTKVGHVLIAGHSFYDRVTLNLDPKRMGESAEGLTDSALLRYNDGIRP